MAAITAAMLVAATNYGNNLIFLLAFAMLALILNSAWQAWRAIASVRIHPMPPAMRAAGTPGAWPVQLASRAGMAAIRLAIEDGSSASHAFLPPGESVTLSLALPPAPRGYLPLPVLTLSTRFPLGLWEVERHMTSPAGQWLHPVPIEGSSQEIRPTDSSRTGSRRDPSGDPTHLRAYQPGDPVRRIVFRHYAKTGRLVSRQPEGEPQPVDPVVIDYDRYRGGRETRLSAMTQRLLALSDRGEPWTLRLPGQRPIVEAGGRDARQARQQALQLMARFGRIRDDEGFDHVPPGTEEMA